MSNKEQEPLKALLENVQNKARDIVETMQEELVAVVLAEGTKAIAVIPVAWNTDREKDAAFDAAFEVVRTLPGVERYAFVSESWITNPPEGTTAEFVRPSLDPERKEIVLVVVGDRDGGQLAARAEITRTDEGKRSLGVFEEMPGVGEGRFDDVFGLKKGRTLH